MNDLRIPSKILNNITGSGENRLYYGKNGSVQFASGTPLGLRSPFLQNGSGHNLERYQTFVSLDRNTDSVKISVKKAPKLPERILKKLGIKCKKPILEKSIDYFSGNNNHAAKDVKALISGDEFGKFFKEMKLHRKIANHLFGLIL